MERLILVDGNAILHRAYHALPPFTTPDGRPSGAIFGFTSMLLKVIADLKPKYIVCAFDRAAPTFRQELFVGYQQGRPAMEEALVSQVEGVHQIVESLNIPIFELDGYEADDIIGTLAKQAKSEKRKAKNIEVVIVSGDRDLLQLVNSHVKIYMPVKGLSEAKMHGGEEVRERYGVNPGQIIDMKALTGDPSDNYPGVTGIGPKTASSLLKKYQNLENIYKHVSELPEKQEKALAEYAEQAMLAKKLATIVCNVPIKLKLEECRFKVRNKEKAIKVFRSFGFRTLTDRLIDLIKDEPTHKTKASDQLRFV